MIYIKWNIQIWQSVLIWSSWFWICLHLYFNTTRDPHQLLFRWSLMITVFLDWSGLDLWMQISYFSASLSALPIWYFISTVDFLLPSTPFHGIIFCSLVLTHNCPYASAATHILTVTFTLKIRNILGMCCGVYVFGIGDIVQK